MGGGRLLARFALVFGALAAKGIVSVAIVFGALERAEHNLLRTNLAHTVNERYLALSATSGELFKLLENAARSQDPPARDAEIEALERESNALIDAIRASIAAEISLVGDEETEELALLARVERSLGDANRAFRRLGRWRARGDPRVESELAATLAGGPYLDFRQAVAEALAGEAEEIAETEAEAAREIALMRAVAFVVFAVGLAAAAAALRALRRDLTGPVARLQAGAAAVGAGALDHRIAPGGPRELAELAEAFNVMAARIAARERELASARDLLEEKVAARTASLEHALARLAEVERTRRSLLSDVSHELRTPLTLIRGEAEFALRGRALTPDAYRETLATMRDAAIHCAQVVEDLLFVARADEGAVRLTVGSVDLAPLLAGAVELARGLSGAEGGTIRFETALTSAVVRADAQKIRQAALILIENALRHGGGDAEARLERREGAFVVSVTDHGPGMTAAEAAAAFDRFHRGPSAAARHPQGSGLGLCVARAIVLAHGGRIGLDSAPGAGTAAWFALPVPAAD